MSESAQDASAQRIGRGLNGIAFGMLLLLGVVPTLLQHQNTWALRFALLAAAALWLANARREWLRVIGVSLAVVLVVNQLLAPLAAHWLPRWQLVTLPPGMQQRVVVRDGALPGIAGTQQVSTDARGFRTTLPVDYATKPANTLRVLAIGGSTTEQIYLDDRKTWTHLLQEDLARSTQRPVEVINAGVSGLRAVQHLATLKHGLRFQPDVVLILMGINDWNKQIRDELVPGRGSWAEALAALSYERTPLILLTRALRARFAGERAAAVPAEAVREITPDTFSGSAGSLDRKPLRVYPEPFAAGEEYRRVAEAMLQQCRAAQLRCVFITQPHAYDPGVDPALRQRFWMTPPDEPFTLSLAQMQGIANAYNGFLVRDLAGQGAEVCDLAPELKPTFDNFYDDCHFNEGGARNVARVVHACLARPAAGR